MAVFNLADAVAARAPIPTYKPAPEDEKFIRDSMAYLVMKHAFWAHLLYNEMKIAYTEYVPFGATDSYTIFLNPKVLRANKWTFAQVAFMLAHEVAHYFFGDLVMAVKFRADGQVVFSDGTVLPYDHYTMNCAEDFRINAMLVEGKVGAMPPVGLLDKKYSEKGMERSVDIYRKMIEDGKGGGGSGQDDGEGHGGFDIHLAPSKGDTPAAEQKRTQAVVAAAQAAEAAGQGNLPAALKVLLGEILDPHVPWQDFLRSTMMRKSGDPIFDWRYLDKRLLVRDPQMYFARPGHTGAGTVVIGYDTSGSCVNIDVQTRFFSEMAGIVADLNPQELIVIWCDAKVQRVDELEEPEDLDQLRMEINDLGGAPGGGGTDFRPVFRKVEKLGLQPDMLVYLTDTYGSFPQNEPDYPVIWASIVKGVTVPFGDLVEVDL